MLSRLREKGHLRSMQPVGSGYADFLWEMPVEDEEETAGGGKWALRLPWGSDPWRRAPAHGTSLRKCARQSWHRRWAPWGAETSQLWYLTHMCSVGYQGQQQVFFMNPGADPKVAVGGCEQIAGVRADSLSEMWAVCFHGFHVGRA